MNDRQNTVVATVLAALILVPVFLCPWRVESSGEITWSPIYQPPISYVRSYDDNQGSQGVSWFEYEGGEVAVDILILEILAVVAVGGVLYVLASDRDDKSSTRPLN